MPEANARANALRLRLFGEFRLADAAGREIALSGRKTRALFTYLAMQSGRPVRRDAIAGLLWGERFDAQARQSLRQAMTRVRKALPDDIGPLLETADDEIMLDPQRLAVDVLEFERLAGSDRPVDLEVAAELAAAPLLASFRTREQPFDDWLVGERARLDNLAADILDRLSAHQAAGSDTEAAVATLERLMRLDPVREDACRRRMSLLAESGRRSEALRVYQAFAQVLDRELGVAPDAETQALYAAIRSAEPAPPTADDAASRAGPPLPDMPAIAVLPFVNLSGDPGDDYFSEGIADELITALSHVRSFLVIARNSSFIYKGRAVDVKHVGRELGVHYVLEGSVRKTAGRVRVTAELVDASSGRHVWADRFDEALDDIFEVQDRIATSVAGAIEPQLLRVEVERVRQKRPDSLAAYDHMLYGLHHMNRLTPEDTATALEHFMQAIALDPGYARAYACAAWCHRRQVQLKGRVLSANERKECVRLARMALKADSTDPYVLWQVGIVVAMLEGDHAEARTLIDRSLAINRNSNRAWLASALLNLSMGEPERAIENAERAIRLSPLDVALWVAYGALASAKWQLGDVEAAIAHARTSLGHHPDNLPVLLVLIASLVAVGDDAAAAGARGELLARAPDLKVADVHDRFDTAGFRNADALLDSLRAAGIPD